MYMIRIWDKWKVIKMKKVLPHLGYFLIGILIWGSIGLVVYITEHHVQTLEYVFMIACVSAITYLSGFTAYQFFKSR
jgi:hypothetical protein